MVTRPRTSPLRNVAIMKPWHSKSPAEATHVSTVSTCCLLKRMQETASPPLGQACCMLDKTQGRKNTFKQFSVQRRGPQYNNEAASSKAPRHVSSEGERRFTMSSYRGQDLQRKLLTQQSKVSDSFQHPPTTAFVLFS